MSGAPAPDTRPTSARHDVAGHYHTAAGALAFVGALGLTITGVAVATSTELRFIDPSAMGVFSLLFLGVAAVMAFVRDR